MALKIVLSPEAIKQLDLILDYLEKNWNEAVINQFLFRLVKDFNIISEFPHSFPVSNKRKQLRKCVLSKQHSLFYIVRKNKIHIVSIFDNRQSPDKLKKNLD
jgi:plasmid stabilization system protein ParE